MSPPSTTGHRCAVALLLGVVAALSVCAYCAFRSAAAQRTAWINVVPRAGGLAVVGHDRSLGKSIITWAPLRDAERAAFDATGEYGPAKIGAGDHLPPAWSSFHATGDGIEDSGGSGPFAHVRVDISVGWPLRAFACTTRAADPRRVEGGVTLPIMGADQGRGYVVAETRALPLRPIWAGIAGNVLFFSLGAYAILLCWTVRERHRAGRPTRIMPSFARRMAVCAALGVACSVCTGVVLPLTLRERSVTATSTSRAGAYFTRDMCWTRRSARLSPEEAATLTTRTAASLDAALASLTYSTDPARHARSHAESQVFGPAAPQAPATSFTSVATGWPFACLWGVYWQAGDGPAERVDMHELPPLAGLANFMNHGVRPFPTRVLWLGWAGNACVFGLAWWGLGLLARRSSDEIPLASLEAPPSIRRAA